MRTERDQTTEYDYDMLVIGSGPGGQKAAIAAAKLGRRAAVVERRQMVGGVCINTGTIPSKTLREAVIYLTGLNMRDLYGASYRLKSNITVQDLLSRTQHVIGREIEIIRARAPEVPEVLARDVATAVSRLRGFDIAKRPGVAETIDWANAVAFLGADHLDEETAAATLGAVLKDHEDQQLAVERLGEVFDGRERS